MEKLRLVNKTETKEQGVSNTKEVIFVRHGQRGVGEGSTNLTPYGRDQANATGKRLKDAGVKLENYDQIEVEASYSGDVDPVSGLPRAAETIKIVGQSLGMSESESIPKRLSHLELGNPLNPPHYDHNEVLRSHLPANYAELSEEDKLRAEQVALSRTLDDAMADQSAEAVTYRTEIAGAAAFVLLTQIGILKNERSETSSLLLIGMHSTFLEWLFSQALVWTDPSGFERIGYESLQDIGGPMNYAEAVRMRLSTDSHGDVQAIEVLFTDPGRPLRSGYLDTAKLIELATVYAELHFPEES